jgi:hypothetical protein
MHRHSIAGALWQAKQQLCAVPSGRTWRVRTLFVMLIAILYCPQQPKADIITETITGMVVSGTDTTGVFGSPNSDLANEPFTLVYDIDSSKAYQSVLNDAITGIPVYSSIAYPAGDATTNPITAVLTIDNRHFSYGILPNTGISTAIIRDIFQGPQIDSSIIENYGVSTVDGYTIGGSSASVVIGMTNPPYVQITSGHPQYHIG